MKRLPRKLKFALENRIEKYCYPKGKNPWQNFYRLKRGEKKTHWTLLALKILRKEEEQRQERLRLQSQMFYDMEAGQSIFLNQLKENFSPEEFRKQWEAYSRCLRVSSKTDCIKFFKL